MEVGLVNIIFTVLNLDVAVMDIPNVIYPKGSSRLIGVSVVVVGARSTILCTSHSNTPIEYCAII